MKIKEMMELDIFSKSKLLTKDVGVDNEVETAMVLEALDIENWSKKNQLILTSFYAFKEYDLSFIRQFFYKMKEMGISGLVIKMDRLITMIPEWLISLCFEFEIPLIKLSQNITYEEIMLALYEPILNYQSHVLRTYYEVRQRFTKVERNLSSFEQIIDEFYSLAKKSCHFTINAKNTSIKRGEIQKDLVVTDQEFLKHTEFTKNNYELLTLFSHSDAKVLFALKVTIQNPYLEGCTLLIYQESKEVKETDLMIMENAVDVIQERIQMDYLLKRERYARLNNLADAILQNTPNNLDELNSLLDEANMNRFPYYQAITLSTKDIPSAKELRTLTSKLSHLKEHVLYFDHLDYSVILYNFEQASECIQKKELLLFLKEILHNYPSLTVAISSIKKKENLKEILIECLDILRFNQEYFIDHVLELSDIGIFYYFVRENRMDELKKLVPEKLYLLFDQYPDLFETFNIFLESSRNYKKTAETMFLHPKTIRYRLNKIEELLAIDLNNPVQLLNYEIGTYLLKNKRRSK